MNIFVVAKSPVRQEEWDDACWRRIREQGHSVTVADPNDPKTPLLPYGWAPPDAIIGMGVTSMAETFAAKERWPNARLYCYNWDTYEWVWTKPRKGEYDYRLYGELLKLAHEVWVPSNCTGRRCEQWWGIKNWRRILSACPWWDHPKVHDGGYAFCAMREIPDPWWGVFERCCSELGIPYISNRHETSTAVYQDQCAGCRFICCPLYECSTGGLSLMEAYYHGKPCLISDSIWNGGRDYMGDRPGVVYFKHGDEEDFKQKLNYMMCHGAGDLDLPSCRRYITENFSSERMADGILRRLTCGG